MEGPNRVHVVEATRPLESPPRTPPRRRGGEQGMSREAGEELSPSSSCSSRSNRRDTTGVGLVAMKLAGVFSPQRSNSSASFCSVSSTSDGGDGSDVADSLTIAGAAASPAVLPAPALGPDSVAEWIASSNVVATVRPRKNAESKQASAPARSEAASSRPVRHQAAGRLPGPGVRKHLQPLKDTGGNEKQGKWQRGEDVGEEADYDSDGESVMSCATTASRLSISSLQSHLSSSSGSSVSVGTRRPTRAMQIAAQLRLETSALPPISLGEAGDRSSRGSASSSGSRSSTGSSSPSSESSDDGCAGDGSVLGVCASDGGGGGGWRDDVPQFCMGVKWLIRNNKLVVGSFSGWSVADKMGVKHGDILRSVDGVDVLAMAVGEDGKHPAMKLLSGDYGTMCKLRVMRVDQDQVKSMMAGAKGGTAGGTGAAKLKLVEVSANVPRLISVSAGQDALHS